MTELLSVEAVHALVAGTLTVRPLGGERRGRAWSARPSAGVLNQVRRDRGPRRPSATPARASSRAHCRAFRLRLAIARSPAAVKSSRRATAVGIVITSIAAKTATTENHKPTESGIP